MRAAGLIGNPKAPVERAGKATDEMPFSSACRRAFS
jgi:hypothetical protein